MKKIKIASGFSHRGGSTIALIKLTNYLNDSGYDTTFYGPHEWHLSKCKSDKIQNLKVNNSDILITHFLNLNKRPPAKKVILSCHEKNLFEVGQVFQHWDTVVFLNEKHREYHFIYGGPYKIIPNLKEELVKKDKKGLEKIAGVIGSFDENKQTHVSIKRALENGCEKVYLFGEAHGTHFEKYVKPLLSKKVICMGFFENKQEMYDMIGCVYHSSLSEVATLVKDECEVTGTKFFGNDATNPEVSVLTNDEVINKWIELFN